MIKFYKSKFAEIISQELALTQDEILNLIEIPPENIAGDLALPCFKLSKLLKKSPETIANELKEKINKTGNTFFDEFTTINGYLNAQINKLHLIKYFFENSGIGNYQQLNVSQNTKTKILIEYMNANPNKPLHIGQARNVCIGDSLRRIFKYFGYEIDTANYGDDSGVNVGYNIVGHLYYEYPTTSDMKYDHYCGKIYEEMRKKAIINKDGKEEENPIFKRQLSSVLQKIETGDPEIYEIHKNYTQKCVKEQINSCRRLGASFDLIIRETDILHRKFFAKTINILKEKGYLKFVHEGEAKGCRIIDISSLPEYAKEEKKYQILIKSDGVASYIGKDIAFAMWKLGYIDDNFNYKTFVHEPDGNIIYTSTSETPQEKSKFGNYNKAITIIDNRQIPAQNIVLSALKLMGYINDQKQYIPLGYGVVYLTPQTLIKLGYKLTEKEKSEKRLPFSSRKGRTVTLDETLEMLHQKAYFESKERNPEKDDVRLDEVAEKIAIGSLRFFLIKGDINKDIVFDIDEILNMEGETGTYIMYTGARIQSILDQAEKIVKNANIGLLQDPHEFMLVKKLTEFDEVIFQAKENLSPHLISKYLFELSTTINTYYAHVKILKAEEETKNARILLLYKSKEILKKGMELIGIPFLERM